MTERVYLHVGGPKSGTTYLQQVLDHNRGRLAEHGVLVAGSSHLELIHAAMAVREDPRLAELPPAARLAWQRLTAQVRASAAPVAVVSYELFAGASAEQVSAALADLDGLEVHVVITARDLAKALPSAWQERLKFALTTPLEQWRPRPESAGPRAEWGWRTMDPAGVAGRWGASLPPEQVHVVTAPRAGSAGKDELWHRFAAACGIQDVPVALEVERVNQSLGLAAAELLRRVNVRLGDRLPGSREQSVWLRDTLAHGVLADQGDEPLGLTAAQLTDAQERATAAVAAITEAGYDVRGDLDDLRADAYEARTPGQATEAELLAVAEETIVRLLLLLRERVTESGADEHAGGAIARGRVALRRAVGGAAGGRTTAHDGRGHDGHDGHDAETTLRHRVAALERQVKEERALHLRVADLTDLVTQLLLPAAVADEKVTAEAIRRYREDGLGPS